MFNPNITYSSDLAGLLACSPSERLPVMGVRPNSGRCVQKVKRAYSSGYCSGIPGKPGHLIPFSSQRQVKAFGKPNHCKYNEYLFKRTILNLAGKVHLNKSKGFGVFQGGRLTCFLEHSERESSLINNKRFGVFKTGRLIYFKIFWPDFGYFFNIFMVIFTGGKIAYGHK